MIGQTLGPYRITSDVARGGQATLYKAVHTVLGRETALKVLHPHLITVADFLQKFEAESRILARLKHPNIVAVYDAGVDRGLYWIAMEWLDGQPVDNLIAQQGKLPVDLAVRIADQVAAALEYAHAQGLIHRDIKPGNMMLLPDGTVKVLDFGIAAIIAAGQKAVTRIGTMDYMSYEQFDGRADHRSDVYSLGASLYHMLTGQLPPPLAAHAPTPVRQLNPRVTSDLEAVLYQALRQGPEDRYQTIREFRRALRITVAAITDARQAPVRRCSHCSTDNRIGAKYCKDCGQPLATSISGALPLVVRQMSCVAWCDGFEPRFTWLPGRNAVIFTDMCVLPHQQGCTYLLAPGQCPHCGAANAPDRAFCHNCGGILSIARPPIEELDHFRKRCGGCGAFLRSVGLYRFDEGSGDRELLATCLSGDTRLDTSQDGRRVVFTSANDLKIWELDIDKKRVQRLTDGDGEHLCPQYLTNGVLAYLNVSERLPAISFILQSEIRFHDLATNQLLTAVPLIGQVVFTSDITRKHFAIESAEREVAMLSARDRFRSIKQIPVKLPRQHAGISRLVLSPDGNTLTIGYYISTHRIKEDMIGELGIGHEVLTIDVATGATSKTVSAAAVWTPNARFVADPRSGVFEHIGKDFTPLVLFGPTLGHAFHWSPNERKLLAEQYQGQIWALNPDGVELQYLTEGYAPQWSPDGQHIAFLRSPKEGEHELWVMRVEPA